MAERIDEIEHGSNEGDALDPVPPGRRERVRRDAATHLANAVAGEGIDIVQLLHGAGDADAVEEEKENDSAGEEREDAAGDAVNRPVEPAIGIEDRFEDNAENDAADAFVASIELAPESAPESAPEPFVPELPDLTL